MDQQGEQLPFVFYSITVEFIVFTHETVHFLAPRILVKKGTSGRQGSGVEEGMCLTSNVVVLNTWIYFSISNN